MQWNPRHADFYFFNLRDKYLFRLSRIGNLIWLFSADYYMKRKLVFDELKPGVQIPSIAK